MGQWKRMIVGTIAAASTAALLASASVLEGAVRMQVKGQPERIFNPGETFFEAPSGVHVVSANASQEAPARFLAYFVCDRATPLSVPVTDAGKRP